MTDLLVGLIRIFHFIIVGLILISIFVDNCFFKLLVFILLVFLLLQYFFLKGHCGLTELEYLVMGENYKSGFMHRMISPFITVPENYINSIIFFIHILWMIILGVQISRNCGGFF